MPLGHHIRLRLLDDRVIARDDNERRLVARVVLRLGKDFGLLAFRCADTHLHMESTSDRPASGQLARRVEITLTQRLPHDVGFSTARIDPIVRQDHLYNAFDYILRQDKHHGIQMDPFHDASVLPELLRFRAGPSYVRTNVEAFLPRVTQADLVKHLGDLSLDRAIETFAPLADAAAASLALPSLEGNRPNVVLARAGAVVVASPHLMQKEIASLLQRSPRTISRLARHPVPATLVEAIELQLRLRQGLRVRKL